MRAPRAHRNICTYSLRSGSRSACAHLSGSPVNPAVELFLRAGICTLANRLSGISVLRIFHWVRRHGGKPMFRRGGGGSSDRYPVDPLQVDVMPA